MIVVKKYKTFLLMLLVMFPTIVYASSGSDNFISLESALIMEAFISIHVSVFVLKPLSEIISKENSKKTFWKLFFVRIGILLIFDLFITPSIALIDFFAVFIGAFIVVPLSISKNKNNHVNNNLNNNNTVNYPTNIMISSPMKCSKCGGAIRPNDRFCNTCRQGLSCDNNPSGVAVLCTKCNSVIKITDKFCGNCGSDLSKEISLDKTNQTEPATFQNKKIVTQTDFDMIYHFTEDVMLEKFIDKELAKAGVDKGTKLIPSDVLKRKKILSIIFSVLLFVYVSLIFFHFPLMTYIIGAIILFIFYKITKKYDFMKYLKKEIKARPSEKILNIIMNVKNTFTVDNSKVISVATTIIAIVIPLMIFSTPKIMYEKVNGGYNVRFYAYGLTNMTSATIPEKHNGKDVVGLRGNAFSNMPFLKEVTLPDTITEIRGQAFKNDYSLTKVNIPKNLKYLGGGSFANCKSIKSVEIPDSVTYMGGEIFSGATSLESVKLSKNIKEIRGNSFEECHSLKKIEIPDKVTRIGGHAFYGCDELSEVTISVNSKLNEIGSSAFRLCDNLGYIVIPVNTYVNERAFKESPTTVRRFGEIEFGNIINENDYEHNSFVYLQVGEKEEVGKYYTNSNAHNSYIELKNTNVTINGTEFFMQYTDKYGKVTEFTLTKGLSYYKISDDVAVEVSAEYVFDRPTSVSLNVYYN